MNEARRKTISEIHNKLDQIKADIENLRDEEQDTFDNMPESFQSGDKGEKAEAAIDALDGAANSIEEVMNYLDAASE